MCHTTFGVAATVSVYYFSMEFFQLWNFVWAAKWAGVGESGGEAGE